MLVQPFTALLQTIKQMLKRPPLNPPVKEWQGLRVWVIGASSGIGAAVAQELLKRGARVALTARNETALQALITDYTPTNAMVAVADVTNPEALASAYQNIKKTFEGIDVTLVVAGSHIEMRAQSFNLEQATQLITLNIGGVLNSFNTVLPDLLASSPNFRGIGIVSSVAGYSGLPKALIYGPSKAALNNFCESLYLDLHPSGVAVYLINPGFVDTPLTQKNTFKMPSLISAEQAAQEILQGMERGQFEIHFPKRFTRMLKFLRLLPYRMYFGLVKQVAEEKPDE